MKRSGVVLVLTVGTFVSTHADVSRAASTRDLASGAALRISGVFDLGSSRAARARGVGDVDGDGKDDVAVLTARDIAVVRGRGPGRVAADDATAVAVRVSRSGRAPAISQVARVGDVDGDDRADLVVQRTDGAIALVASRGRGAWVDVDRDPLPLVQLGFNDAGVQLAGGRDANGDGRPDLLVGLPGYERAADGLSEPGGALLLNALADAGTQDAGPALAGEASSVGVFSPGTRDRQRLGGQVDLVPDVNGDGRADLALLRDPFEGLRSAGIGEVRLGPGGAAVQLRLFGSRSACPTGIVGVGDLTGDRLGDVVVGDPCGGARRGALRLIPGSRSATDVTVDSSRNRRRGLLLPRGYSSLLDVRGAGDLDGNGTVDLLASVRRRGQAVVLELLTARGKAPLRLSRSPALRLPGRAPLPALDGGDVDGDGRDDAIVSARDQVIIDLAGPRR